MSETGARAAREREEAFAGPAGPSGFRPADPGPPTWLDRLGRRMAEWLDAPSSGYEPYTPSDPETLGRVLQPGDVLLVEGNTRVSAGIKYLTQSTWSHAALFVGGHMPADAPPGIGVGPDARLSLVEANLGEGVVAVPLAKYLSYNTRICRAVALTAEDREAVCRYAISKLGLHYDLKNIIDMARWFFPTPPVPVAWRRRMIAFGSGEPTRAICSTIIAQGFQSIRYPILPRIERLDGHRSVGSPYARREVLHIRHHTLFTPRDFDLSPYFEIVKPTIAHGFDYKRVEWAEGEERPARA